MSFSAMAGSGHSDCVAPGSSFRVPEQGSTSRVTDSSNSEHKAHSGQNGQLLSRWSPRPVSLDWPSDSRNKRS